VLHVAIYVGFDRSLSLASTLEEIWMRRFLQVGTAAVFLMVPLAITSTNGMIQSMGPKRWKLLHRLAYVVAALGVIHYYMLVKSDVRQPIAFGVVLAGLLGSRFGWHYFDLRKAASKSTSSVAKAKAGSVEKKRKFWSGELKIAAVFQETPTCERFDWWIPTEEPFHSIIFQANT
jgi:glycine betaine catabolism B